MSDAIVDPRYPAGTGWLVGYALGAGIGLVVSIVLALAANASLLK